MTKLRWGKSPASVQFICGTPDMIWSDRDMGKKFKKYEQSITSPYFEPTQGSKLAQGLAAIVARLFGTSPAAAPTRQDIIDYHLTPREREIAYLAALGFSDKEIADALVMNFQTVRVHLRNILNKLQLDDVHGLYRYFSPREHF